MISSHGSTGVQQEARKFAVQHQQDTWSVRIMVQTYIQPSFVVVQSTIDRLAARYGRGITLSLSRYHQIRICSLTSGRLLERCYKRCPPGRCQTYLTALLGEAASLVPYVEFNSPVAPSNFDLLVSGHRLTQTT